LHGDPQLALHDLPAGYEPKHWAHSRYLYRSHGLDLGSIRCAHCQHRAKHVLRWPADAYFSISDGLATLLDDAMFAEISPGTLIERLHRLMPSIQGDESA
jgi:hypothetical protein